METIVHQRYLESRTVKYETWNPPYLEYPQMKSLYNLGGVVDDGIHLDEIVDTRNNL